MRIISKIQDFYDYANPYYDDTVVYDRRDSIELDLADLPYKIRTNPVFGALKNIKIPFGVLLYGREYFVARPYLVQINGWKKELRWKPIIDWHKEVSWIQETEVKEIESLVFNADSIETLLLDLACPLVFLNFNRAVPYYYGGNTSVGHYSGELIVITNPILKDMGLANYLDSWLVNQKVEEMLIKINDPSRNMIEVSDKHKAEVHGFGHRYAFRKS